MTHKAQMQIRSDAQPFARRDTGLAGGEGQPPSRARPVDLVFLAQRTGGDRQAERDVLMLLRSQIALILQRAPHASQQEIRQMATAIKGAGRHVGAFAVADSAARLAIAVPGAFGAAYADFMECLGETADFLRSLEPRG